jgi:hypothetical protein
MRTVVLLVALVGGSVALAAAPAVAGEPVTIVGRGSGPTAEQALAAANGDWQEQVATQTRSNCELLLWFANPDPRAGWTAEVDGQCRPN